MAESKEKTLSLRDFLGMVVISKRDRWVVERMLKGSDPKTHKKWVSELKSKCKGVSFKVIE